ncbi:LmeA family phospholipid-binding protein [Glaciibacter flavus]|uniref:LmeA family phospholipid-binding protein n=1 Tax=Orlajensenia flava TaxID=2565934 RepID=UPI003B007DEE
MTTDARRRSRGPLALIIVIVVLAALVGAFFVADNIARGIAEKQVSSEIATRIPGADPSQVTVGIGGVSFLAQLASGRFESVVVDAADVKVQGAPITLHARAASVPTDTTQPIGDVEGSAVLDEAAVNALVAASGNDATVTLQSGTVGYEVDKAFLGIPLGFTVTAAAAPKGGTIVFTPQSAKLTAGGASFDVSSLVDSVVSDSGFSVCVASSLPAGLQISDIAVTPGQARIGFTAKDLVLADAGTTGTC